MNHIQPFIVGDYLFVELLSSTRPFFVHRVIDLSEREFSYFKAFKNVNPEYVTNPVFSTDLAHEAATLRALHSPAVPQFYDYGVVNGQAYLIYRYVWGKSLLQILRELKRHSKMLSDAYAIHFATEVARILAKAHHRGGPHPGQGPRPARQGLSGGGRALQPQPAQHPRLVLGAGEPGLLRAPGAHDLPRAPRRAGLPLPVVPVPRAGIGHRALPQERPLQRRPPTRSSTASRSAPMCRPPA